MFLHKPQLIKETKITVSPFTEEEDFQNPDDENNIRIQIIANSETEANLGSFLAETNHIFISQLKSSDQNISSFKNLPSYVHVVKNYSIENDKGVTIMFANQVELGSYDLGKLPISYDAYDTNGNLAFTVDGQETKCGMNVIIKGPNGNVRGKVCSGINCYMIDDYLTGLSYSINIPKWIFFCTCFLCLFHPVMKIRQNPGYIWNKQKQRNKTTENYEQVAVIGRCKWPGTVFSDVAQFGIKFEENVEADVKLFIFSCSLSLFHLYFRKSSRELRCFAMYGIIITITILIMLILGHFIM